MTGASIETTLEFWALSLGDMKVRLHPLLVQKRTNASGPAQ